jgi:PRTRC genetic system protein A
VTEIRPFFDGASSSWPERAPARYGFLVAHDGPPEPHGLIADIVLDGAGLYVAASTPYLTVRVRLTRAAIPDLPVVPTGVTLTHGPIDFTLWEALVEHAHAAMPHELLLALIARESHEGERFVAAAGPYTLVEPLLDEMDTGDWQPQQASGCSVRATSVSDAVIEIHSHHAMRAYFSYTDDQDETARRVYGVLGRLNTSTPECVKRTKVPRQFDSAELTLEGELSALEVSCSRRLPTALTKVKSVWRRPAEPLSL